MRQTNYEELLWQVGQNLNTIRNIRKEKLQAVAQTIGTSHPVLSKIENGHSPNLTLVLLIKLCNYYDVSLMEIVQPTDQFIVDIARRIQNNE